MPPLYPSFTHTYHHDQYPTIDPSQPHLDCSAKIILITGAGRGIGQAIAVAFAQAHAKGIALLGRTRSTLEETATKVRELCPATDVFLVTADITDQSQVQSAFDALIQHYSGAVPDVLINNAGGLAGVGALVDVEIAQFWKALELNTKGPLIVTQAFLRAARDCQARQKDTKATKTLINIPSGSAHIPYAPGAASYACSKLASAKMFEYLHYEYPAWDVFNLQPGVVATELARQAGRNAPDHPRLPAGMAVWLAASPEARQFNGCFLWANWDVGELLERAAEIRARGLLRIGLKGWADGYSVEELVGVAKSVHRDADRRDV